MNDNQLQSELINFCNVLSVAVKTGKPLPDSIRELSGSLQEGHARQWCRQLSEKLASGYSAVEAAKELRDFDPVLARLMPLIGQGRLEKMLDKYSIFLINLALVAEKLSSVVFYPIVVLLIIFVNLVYTNFSFFPALLELISKDQISPPLLMRLFYFLHADFWPISLILPGILLFLVAELFRMVASGRIRHTGVFARLFGVSNALKLTEFARIQGLISLYLQAGFSLEKAIREAAAFAEEDYRESLENTAQSLEHGSEPSFAFSLTPLLADLQGVNLSAESLPGRLEFMADGNNRLAAALINRFSTIMFAVSLALTGIFVALFTASVFDSYYWLIWSLS